MKFTQRKNGQKMATIKVEFHVGYTDLWMTLYMMYSTYDEEAFDRCSTRSKVRKILELNYQCSGEYYFMDRDFDDNDQAKEFADKMMQKLWPDLPKQRI